MGELLKSFTYDRNVIRASISKSASTVFDILDKVKNNESLSAKVDTNIFSALASYFGLVDSTQKKLTPLGDFCLNFSKIDSEMTYRWILTRSLERYQIANGTSSPNNIAFKNAGIITKPFRMVLGLCVELARLDVEYPFLTFNELFNFFVDDDNWHKSYEELSQMIFARRETMPVKDIIKDAGNNTILGLESTFSVPRDNWNGFLGKTLEQTGLFTYYEESRHCYAIGIKPYLDIQEEKWVSHVLINTNTWDDAVQTWDQYLSSTENELPRLLWMNFPPILIPFLSQLQKKGLYYDYRVIKSYVASLATRHFVVLSGNSGTGKSSISSELAVYMGADSLPYYGFVEVGANWKNNEHIIGYWDSLACPDPVHRDAEILQVIKNASNITSTPHFITLDEMNLSHVEWYFSDYLSIMEREPDQRLIKYAEKGDPGSGTVKLGDNVFVTGTVNVDYTTFSFSPKVLDRAHVIEVPAVSPINFGKSAYGKEPILDTTLEKQLKKEMKDFLIRPRTRKSAEDISKTRWGKYTVKILSEIWEILKPAGFQFGPRVIADSLIYMDTVRELCVNAGESDWVSGTEKSLSLALDEVTMQKILTKIDGQRGKLEEYLRNLSDYFKITFLIPEKDNLSYNKTTAMLNQLRTVGYTNFFGS